MRPIDNTWAKTRAVSTILVYYLLESNELREKGADQTWLRATSSVTSRLQNARSVLPVITYGYVAQLVRAQHS